MCANALCALHSSQNYRFIMGTVDLLNLKNVSSGLVPSANLLIFARLCAARPAAASVPAGGLWNGREGGRLPRSKKKEERGRNLEPIKRI